LSSTLAGTPALNSNIPQKAADVMVGILETLDILLKLVFALRKLNYAKIKFYFRESLVE